MTNQDTILEVDNTYWADQLGRLNRLKNNPDFQGLILEGYFKDHAVNCVSLLANEGIKQSGRRPDIMEDLIGISSLEDFFLTVENMSGSEEDAEGEG